MTFQVFDSVLAFAIKGLMQILDDLRARRLRPFKVRIDIFDEDSQALRVMSNLRRTHAPRPRAVQHDPGIAQMHLRAADLLPSPP